MSCPIFSKEVSGVWVHAFNETFNPSGTSSGHILLQPISRNTLLFAPHRVTVTAWHTSSGPGDNFTTVTLSDGVQLNFLAPTTYIEPHDVGYEYATGEFIASLQLGNSFNDAFFAGGNRIYEAETGTSLGIYVYSSSWDEVKEKLAPWVGDEIKAFLDIQGAGSRYIATSGTVTKKCVIFFDLDNEHRELPCTSYQFGSTGEDVPTPTVLDKEHFQFLGWFADRNLMIPFTGKFPENGITFVWGKWLQTSGDTYIAKSVYDRNTKPFRGSTEYEYPENINSNPYYILGVGTPEYGVGVPFYTDASEHPSYDMEELFSDVATVEGGDSRFPIPIPPIPYNPMLKPYNTTIKQETDGTNRYIVYEFTARCVYIGDAIKGERLGIFICPFGARKSHGTGKLSNPFYTYDIEVFDQYYAYSLNNGISSYSHVATLEPYIGVPWLYIFNYPDGDIPIPDIDPPIDSDIIPILTYFSTKITGRPSINMWNRYIK